MSSWHAHDVELDNRRRAGQSADAIRSSAGSDASPAVAPTECRAGDLEQGVPGPDVLRYHAPRFPPRTHSEREPVSVPATETSPTFDGFSSVASSQRPMLGTGVSTEKKRLHALGYEETLKRDYDVWASFGIGYANIGVLQGVYLGTLTANSAGGSAMYTIAWPITGILVCGLVAVLGEMASAYPVAGAMCTWSFRLCRSSRRLDPYARYISWLVGSLLLCAHLLTQIVLSYQIAHMLEGVIGFHVSFRRSFWITIAISWAVLGACGLFVSSHLSRSPLLWKFVGLAITISFVVLNVILLTQAPEIRSAREVFTTYSNGTNFQSRGFVVLIGWCLSCFAGGNEACAHLAEDTKRPARNVPLAMFWSTALSYIFGWITICIIAATTSPSIDSDTEWGPIRLISTILNESYATCIFVLLLFGMLFQSVAQMLATSRFIWALSRESALPFSAFFNIVSPQHRQPQHATWFIVAISAPSLLLLAIHPSIVGTIFYEGTAWATIASYAIPLALYLFCPDDALVGDGRNEWSLRGASKPLTWIVTPFVIFVLIVCCFPTGYPITTLTAPYSPVVAFGIFVLSSLTWIFYGNARYAGPIKTTTLWTLGTAAELPRSSTFNKSASMPMATTSAAHGRSAHIFSSFPTLEEHDPPSLSMDDGEEEEEEESDKSEEEEEEESRGELRRRPQVEHLGREGRERDS